MALGEVLLHNRIVHRQGAQLRPSDPARIQVRAPEIAQVAGAAPRSPVLQDQFQHVEPAQLGAVAGAAAGGQDPGEPR